MSQNTSHFVPVLDADGKPVMGPDGKPLVEERFGLAPDTPEPAPHIGHRRARRPGEEADLPDEREVARQLAELRREKSAAERREKALAEKEAALAAREDAIAATLKKAGIDPKSLAGK